MTDSGSGKISYTCQSIVNICLCVKKFTCMCIFLLFHPVHPHARIVWSLPVHGSCLSKWSAGKNTKLSVHETMRASVRLVFLTHHVYLSVCLSVVHGSSQAASDAGETPAGPDLPATRSPQEGPPLHLLSDRLLGSALDPQVHCGRHHIPCHGRRHSHQDLPVISVT